MKYYTMVEMAKIIGIPESSARGYRDRFLSYMTTTGQGRGKRYTEEALGALRMAATMSREGIPNEDIESALEARFGVAIESQNSQSRTVVSSSQIVAEVIPEEFTRLITQVVHTAVGESIRMQNEELKREIASLYDYIKAMEERQEAREAARFDLELAKLEENAKDRDTWIVAQLRDLTEQKKPWWKFWK